MHSRGVVFGDVHRANDAWNERLEAMGEGAGVAPDKVVTIGGSTAEFLQGDIWDEAEARGVLADLVHAYTGITVAGPMLELLLGLAMHAGAIGVLTERQRWDTEAGVSTREASLEAALRGVRDGLVAASPKFSEAANFAIEELVALIDRVLRGATVSDV